MNHPDYWYITISTDRVTALPVDGDVSSSIAYITDDTLGTDEDIEVTDGLPNSQSIVLSLDQETIEANLILQEITGHKLPITGIPALSVYCIPIDEASGREWILSLAFPTLYLIGQADLNTPRLWKVPLIDYAYHLLCWYDQQFA